MNVNIQGFRNNNFTVGNMSRRESLRNGGNPTTDRMRLSQRLTPMDYHGSLRALAKMKAYKIDGTLLEADRYRLDFITQLRDGNDGNNFSAEETQTRVDRLRSDIKENYKGDGRDMRLAALDAAVSFVTNLQSQRSLQNDLLWQDIRTQLTDNERIFNVGIEEAFARFERLHAEIMENYEGEERDRRLAFLETAFEQIGLYHARTQALRIMNTAGISGAQFGIEGSARVKAWLDTSDGIINHINDMFRSALDFFRTNGSFSGFEDTEAANRPGQLSFRDITIITSDRLSTADDSDLSESGRDFLYSIMNRDFLQANAADGNSAVNVSAEMLHRRQGDLTLDEGILQKSITGSFINFIETGIIVVADNMEDYSQASEGLRRMMADIAKTAFFSAYHGDGNYTVRSLEEMAQLFDDRIAALRNATGISEQRREMEIEALKRGFVMAAQVRLIGTTAGESMIYPTTDSRFSTRGAIGQFALDSAMQILQTGASEEVQNLMFQGLSNIVDRQSSWLAGREFEAVVSRFLRTRFESAEKQEQAWQGILEFNEMLNIQQQSFISRITALIEDMRSTFSSGQIGAGQRGMNLMERSATFSIPNFDFSFDNYWEGRRDALGTPHYLDPRTNQVMHNGYDNGLILTFSGMLQNEMMRNGIESSMALFEKIRADLLENFTGSEEELKARLEALERGFLRASDQFTHMVVGSLMVSSPHYTPEDGSTTLTARQSAANARIQRGADNLIAHMGGMFRAALAFFNATGSFAGFFDTAEANQPGMLSMRDVDLLSRQTFNNTSGTSHTDRINAPGLSSSGRASLQRFFQIA